MVHPFRTPVWLALPVFACVALLTPDHAVNAQGKKNKEPATLTDVQLAQSIQTLRSARMTLEAADHDYGGHRVAAIREIGGAIKHLRLALESVHKGKIIPKGTGKVTGGGGEPQAISDAQLATSMPVLAQTATLLKAAPHDYGGHRTEAVNKLESALQQLDKALKYSKVKNENKP